MCWGATCSWVAGETVGFGFACTLVSVTYAESL